jgi:hypothetical protein
MDVETKMELDLKMPPIMKLSDAELWKLVRRQTERDAAIVWGVHDFGPLTTEQIHRMFFPDLNPADNSQVSRRLSLLRKSGDIHVLKRTGDRRNFFVVGPCFTRDLARHEGGSAGWLWRRMLKNAVRSIASEHFLFTTDLVSCFKSAEARGAGELLDWSRELRLEFRFRGRGWIIIPDIASAWHSNETGKDVQFLLEADLGTETLVVVTDKIHRYILLLQRLGFARDRSGRPGFPAVLLVARTDRRADSISRCVLAAVQKSGIRPDDLRRFLVFAVAGLPMIEERGVVSRVWDTPLDRSGGKRTLDELLPSDHLHDDFRLRSGMLNPRWSKIDPDLLKKQPV